MAWTPVELRAIGEGEKAAALPGVIPKAVAAPDRDAWRAGYARGWNGLGESGRTEGNAKAAFSAGWKAGLLVAKVAARGYKEDDDRLLVALRLLETPWATWSAEQRDAFEDGVQCGEAGLVPMPRLRYRGRLREHDAVWWTGWRDGVSIMTGRSPIIDRHPVTDIETPLADSRRATAQPIAQPTTAASVPPQTGSERQRRYRTRRALRSVDIADETHRLLLRLCARDGVGLDAAVRSAVRSALGKGPDAPVGVPPSAPTALGRVAIRKNRP